MSISILIVASVAFALYVTCPRMTAMMATQTKISGLNPYLMISLAAYSESLYSSCYSTHCNTSE